MSAPTTSTPTCRIHVPEGPGRPRSKSGLPWGSATTAELADLKRLKRENREAASCERRSQGGSDFLRGGARPPIEEVIRFIDAHQHRRSGLLRWGVEPIARTLGVAPSTYHAAKKGPPSARAVRDAELKAQILRVWNRTSWSTARTKCGTS